jgi:ATP-dependent RNA helicase DDX24/MAK5
VGLEVLDGVELVKHSDRVEFMVPISEGAASTKLPIEEEVFEGFADDSDDGHADPISGAINDQDEREQLSQGGTKKEKTKKRVQSLMKDAGISGLPGTNFAALEVLGEEGELDMSAWAPLEVSAPMVASIARLKFSSPTAIQIAAIPEIMAGHDVIGKASTGSGKTLAFAIPVIEKWLEIKGHAEGNEEIKRPFALILSPTRELAKQISAHVSDLGAGLDDSPYICSVTGGLSVHKQRRQLQKADIVIGTPGRLWEVINGDSSLLQSFKQVQFLVVDEADRLLSEGQFEEAELILNALDRGEVDGDDIRDQTLATRQTLVFSATFNKALQQKLAGKGRYNLLSEAESLEYLLRRLNFRETKPKFIDVNPVSQMAERLKEGLVECGAMEKASLCSC